MKDLTTPRSINHTTLDETVAVHGKRAYLDRVRDLILDEEIRAAEIALSAQTAVNDAAEIALSVQRAEHEALRAYHERTKQHEALRAYHEQTQTKDKDTCAGFINSTLSQMEDTSEGVEDHDIFDDDTVSTRRSAHKDDDGINYVHDINDNNNDEKVTQNNNGGGYGKGIQCFNCSGDHKIGRCTELCRKCVVPCRKKSSDCPVYLKYREKALQMTGLPHEDNEWFD